MRYIGNTPKIAAAKPTPAEKSAIADFSAGVIGYLI